MHCRDNETSDKAFQPEIVNIGSCFIDYVAFVEHLPKPGETRQSVAFHKSYGGKGVNQAVAAGRLGAKVAMVGMLGDDGDGEDYLKKMSEDKINTQYMLRESGCPSGLALILVDTTTSNNQIVICPNATERLTPELLRARTNNLSAIFPPTVKYLICQNEIPLATTLAALEEAHRRGMYTVFNSAPAPSPEEVERIKPCLSSVSLFCPNESEASLITNVEVTDTNSAMAAIKALQELGVQDVVITLGSAGFVLSENQAAPVHVEGKTVEAVDTTGAGDCFVGSMVYFMSRGHNLLEACKRANECAAISVTRKGTQQSYAYPSELPFKED